MNLDYLYQSDSSFSHAHKPAKEIMWRKKIETIENTVSHAAHYKFCNGDPY